MKKTQLAVIGMLSIAAFSANIFAATATTTFDVSVVVPVTCNISATGITFNYPTTDANGSINVSCNGDVQYSIALDYGKNSAGTTRQMSDGANSLIAYTLYQDQAHSVTWGDGNADPVLQGSTTAQQGAHTVYGQASFTANQLPGSYSDVVTVSFNY